MSESLDDIIQQALDGAASPDDRARLDARLAADPDARRRYEELRAVFEALSDGSSEDPPPGLHADIMRALPDRLPVPELARPRWTWSRLALPFAAGAIAAAVVVITLRGGPSSTVPEGGASATMSGAASRAVRLGLGTEGAALHVTLWREAEGAARLAVTSDVPTRLSVSSAQGSVTLLEGAGASRSGVAVIAPDHLELVLGANAERVVSCRWTEVSAAVRLRAETAGGEASEIRVELTSLPVAIGR